MGGLPEEGGELPSAGLVVAGIAEGREFAHGLDECVLGVERAALAAAFVAVAHHGVELLPGDDRRHAGLLLPAGTREQRRAAGESEEPEDPHVRA